MSTKLRKIEIYDTTLRDGSQAEGVNFSVQDKLRIAERLDTFGIRYIEGGWPGSNPRDMEFFQLAARRAFRNAEIVAFSMTRHKNTPVEKDTQMRELLAAETPVVTLVGKTWLLHVHEVIRTSPDENLRMITDSIRFMKSHGKRVFYDAEHAFDGYRDNPEYAMATWLAAEKAGADCIVLCDTNGGSLPGHVGQITAAAKEKLKVPVGIHTHNDCGLAVANALVAVEMGATHVQGTINGYGERTGNCNLTTLIPILQLKLGLSCVPKSSMPKLRELSLFVDETANLKPDPRQPWVGANAFAHKGGMHVHAVERIVSSYEHSPPEAVGNVRRVLVSDMSGRTNLLVKARELGIRLDPDSPQIREILNRIKELENQGYEFEAAEASLTLLIRSMLGHGRRLPFSLEAYHVSMRSNGKGSICEATVKLKVGSRHAHTVAEGDGPVNALDEALRAALVKFFPRLRRIKLTDYKVRIIDSGAGTAAKTRVLITSSDGKREWGTVGVSENIITASLQALVDSIEFALLADR
ncbi:MAG: citramalate synthase [Verrucomicrobiae bacterium]|nr:citramalate synthase [Verrucomicrobiae bacterium]